MKLLHKYPWILEGFDDQEWVPVEATPMADHLWGKSTEVLGKVFSYMPRAVDVAGFQTPTHPLSVRPPWPRTIMEFSKNPAPHRGRHFIMIEHHSFVEWQKREKENGWTSDGIDPQVLENTSEVTHMTCYLNEPGVGPFLIGTFVVFLDVTGVVVNVLAPEIGPNWAHTRGKNRTNVLIGLVDSGSTCLGVFAFLNCKNVTTRDATGYIGGTKNKRASKGREDIVYKELVVDGVSLRSDNKSESKETANFRHHICRGHFADHTNKGLFGNPSRRGVFWVPMHTRGSKQNGEVIKDYSVQPAQT